MDPVKYIFEKSTITGRIARWQVLSYPNFVRGPMLGGMQLSFNHLEVLGTHLQAICEVP